MERRSFLMGVAAAPALALGRTGGGPAPGQPEPFDELAALVTAKMAEHGIPGVALGVSKAGRVRTRGFGVTNVEDPQPVTPDTVFPIASISKTVVATAVMRLVEQGRLDLEAPVQRWLPDFRVADPAASREITLGHLLTHTPGFEGQLNTEDRGDASLAVFTEGLRELAQLAPPGAVWSYNNAGFGVAGRAVEVVTGRSIHEALRELVFQPAGMARAFSRLGDVVTYPFALGHRTRAGSPVELIRPFTLFANVPAGGLAMSLATLLAYARLHLGEGEPDTSGFLAPAALERMRTPQVTKNATDDEMGTGWQLRRVGGVLTAAHGGTLGGHCLHVQIVPERRLAFAILTNHGDGWRLIQDVERAALRLYEGLALAPDQRIGHRGVNEAMNAHASPVPAQPSPEPYLGSYHRPPVGSVQVRAEAGRVVIDDTPVAFYGEDVAYATAGAFVGRPYEFIREADGRVRWVRVNGRVARRDG